MKVSVKDRRLVMCLFFTLLTFALAFDYKVDSSGGPLTLEEDIKMAFEKWMNIETQFQANMTEDANTLLKYGNPDLLGPDVVSLSTSKLEGGEQTVAILFNANSDLLTFAILNETGSLAGLEAGGQGVMNPKLSSSSPSEPTSFDRQALTSLALSAPEDINRDGVVDFYDLFELSKAFGPQGINSSADINKDGEVDNEDINLMESAYTFSAPSKTPREQSSAGADNEGTNVEDKEVEVTAEDSQNDEAAEKISSEAKQGEDSEEAGVSEGSQEEIRSKISEDPQGGEVVEEELSNGTKPEDDSEKDGASEGSQNGEVTAEEGPSAEAEGENSQTEVLIDSPENETGEEVPEDDSEKDGSSEGSKNENEEVVGEEESSAEAEGENSQTEVLIDIPEEEADKEVPENESKQQ